MTSTPLTRDSDADFTAAGAAPDFEQLLEPSRFDRAEYWLGLARTNAASLRLMQVVLRTSQPGDPYRDDAAASVRRSRIEIARCCREADRLAR
jgi:hypothetical protein